MSSPSFFDPSTEFYGDLELEVFEDIFPDFPEIDSENDYLVLMDYVAEHDWELPWPFSLIQDFAEQLWNELLSWIDDVKRGVWNFIDTARWQIEEYVRNAVNWVWNSVISPAIDWVKEHIVDQLWYIWENRISPAFDFLYNAVKDTAMYFWNTYIVPVFTGFQNEVAQHFWNLWHGQIDPEVRQPLHGTVIPKVDETHFLASQHLPTTEALGRESISRTQEVINKIDGQIDPKIEDTKQLVDRARQEIYQKVDQTGNDIVSGLANAVKTITDPIGSALQAFFNWLMGALSEVGSGVVNLLSHNVIDPIMSALKWVQDQISGLIGGLWREAISKIRGHSPLEPEEAFNLVPSVVLPLGIGVTAITILLDVLSTKIVGIGLDLKGIRELVHKLAAPEIIASSTLGTLLGVGVRDPLTQFFRSTLRTAIPDMSDAFSMMYRGKLTEEQVRDILARHGYRDEYIDGYFEIMKKMPGVNELISFIVKEAHEEYKQVEFPEQLAEWLKMQGMEEKWARLYWGAHWVLPSVDQVYEMLHRKLLDMDAVRAFLKEADYEPRWRDKLIELSYQLPNIIQARWGLEWGIWDEQRFAEFIEKSGLHPDYVPDVVKIEKANVFREHINLVRTPILNKYKEGFITESDLQARLKEIGFPDEAVNLMIKAMKEQREYDMKNEAKQLYVQKYKAGKIDEGTLMRLLSSLGMDNEYVQEYVKYLSAGLQGTPVAPTTPDLEIERLKESIEQQQLKIMDLQTDLEQRRRELEVAERMWSARLQRQKEYCESLTDEAKRRKCELELEELQAKYELDMLTREGRVRELQEAIKMEEAKLDALRQELEIKQKSRTEIAG